MMNRFIPVALLAFTACTRPADVPELADVSQDGVVYDCSTAADCNDNNPCTNDYCNSSGFCANTAIANCPGPGSGSGNPPALSFAWTQAGALVTASELSQVSASELKADHVSWIAQYAMVGCNNATQPFGCLANGCVFPGNTDGTWVPTYAVLEHWLKNQGSLFAGVWMASANASAETNDDGGAMAAAEGHCMAEVLNKLKADGATPKFAIVDAEKGFELFPHFTNALLTGFPLNNSSCADPTRPCKTSTGAGNGFNTRSYSLSLGESPECHTQQWYSVWASHGFSAFLPQAYWNDGHDQSPSFCVNFFKMSAADGGASDPIAATKVHVMLDGYNGWLPNTQAAYASDMRTSGNVGFSIWRAGSPSNDSAHWATWKTLITQSPHIATY